MANADSAIEASVLEVDRAAPFEGLVRVRESPCRRRAEDVLLSVERFGLSANNLSYILADKQLHTLDAFPASRSDRARVPVWGIAEVVDADPSVVAVGTRLAGFLPMATHVAVRAERIEGGLMALDENRAGMLPIYRRMTMMSNSSRRVNDDIETVLLPVYPFAALLASDITAEGVGTVVVSSASSRAAAAVSWLLTRAGIRVIGLTSAAHRAATKSFEVYAEVLGYDEVDGLEVSDDTMYVDLAGSSDVTRAVHDRLGSRLATSLAVGGTHARSLPPVSGPSLTMFNTGGREVELVGESGWQCARSLYGNARSELVAWASRWLHIDTVSGLTSTESAWRDIVAGRFDPRSAVVIRP